MSNIVLWLLMAYMACVIFMFIVGLFLNIVVSVFLDIIGCCSSIKNFFLKICGINTEEEVYDLTVEAYMQINESEEQDFFHKYILK